MDQVKTGKFIAECRKSKNLTQMQLAEKIGITDKAISKWERGLAMPDSAIMLDLCGILDINVNELLSGERINAQDNAKKTEELLLEMTRKDQRNRKKLFSRALMLMVVMSLLLIGGLMLYWFCDVEWFDVCTIVYWIMFATFIVGGIIAATMEVDSGRFVCKNCQNEFVPKYREAFFTVGYGTPRNWRARLKCPKCGKKTWARRIF